MLSSLKSRNSRTQATGVVGAPSPAPTLIVLANFYPESRRALRFAAGLADHLAAPLVLLHLDPAATQQPNNNSAETRELRRGLRQLVEELHRPVTIELGTGLLSHSLADTARRYAPALFIVGRPADEQADFELSEAIVEKLRAAHLPLLLVPENYTGPTQPQHVAVAIDEEPFALPAGARAARLLLRHLVPGQVTVVVASSWQNDAVCTAALHHVRTSGLLPQPGPLPTVQGFYATQTEQGLLHALASTQADWLVLLAHPRSFLDQLLHRSITKRMLQCSPVPVLVVPSRPATPRARHTTRPETPKREDDYLF